MWSRHKNVHTCTVVRSTYVQTCFSTFVFHRMCPTFTVLIDTGNTKVAKLCTTMKSCRRRKYSGGWPILAGTTKPWHRENSSRTIQSSCLPGFTCTIWPPRIREIWYVIVINTINNSSTFDVRIQNRNLCRHFARAYETRNENGKVIYVVYIFWKSTFHIILVSF